jgi:hypothetical protein
MNGTLQGRLVNELRLAKARSLAEANTYIRDRYLPGHNQAFAVEPRESESAFVGAGGVDLDDVFCREVVRQVGKDNVVTLGPVALQLAKQPGRRSCAGLAVIVKQRLDGSLSVHRGTQIFGRYDDNGRPMDSAGPVESRKRTRLPTRTLDGRQTTAGRPQRPQAPAVDL